MTCSLCDSRKSKRYCPALRSQICPQCCGKEREETIACALDCPYLNESRRHEKSQGLHPKDFPHKEIRITDSFLAQREELLNAAARFLLAAAMQVPGTVDRDVREALDAQARTYKTLESGVLYQTLPDSPVAQAVLADVQGKLEEFRRQESAQAGFVRTRDADVLGILVFLLRMAIDRDNGRKLGRSFIHFLRGHFQPGEAVAQQPSLITPG